ncbi:MAG: hypothetical protein ACXW2E_00120 [Nitrososphaeraceae archaeon]
MSNQKPLTRSDIRYALYRNRSGNPDKNHIEIFKQYQDKLNELGMSISTFADEWDIGVQDPSDLVVGHLLTPLKEKVNSSLFDIYGKVKE